MESLRDVQLASYGDFAGMLPSLLTVFASTLVLIFLPFLVWRTLRGCLAWMKDIAEEHRRHRVRNQRTA
jgi:hypothetical protein